MATSPSGETPRDRHSLDDPAQESLLRGVLDSIDAADASSGEMRARIRRLGGGVGVTGEPFSPGVAAVVSELIEPLVQRLGLTAPSRQQMSLAIAEALLDDPTAQERLKRLWSQASNPPAAS